MDIDPNVVKTLPWFIAVLLLRDLSFAALARLKIKVLGNTDKSDDWVADVVDVVVGVIGKLPFPRGPWTKK